MSAEAQYWNGRYRQDGAIWGYEPSGTAALAAELFRSGGLERVLVPGAGYGRNTKAFSDRGFRVEAVELSEDAVLLGKEWDPETHWVAASALEYQPESPCDAVFCYDLLHLFLQPERLQLVRSCLRSVRKGGVLFFTAFSDGDRHNGMGRRIEDGTYEYQEGKYAHFFSEADLRAHFEGLPVLAAGTVKETLRYERDGSGKEYMLRYIAVRT